VHDLTSFVGGYWWLIFIVGPMAGGAVQRHHARRLKILEAKGKLAEQRSAALAPPPDPQPVCGCSHHLSFHSPQSGHCAVEDCRCQQYVGPEPLGHVFAQPLVDPGAIEAQQG